MPRNDPISEAEHWFTGEDKVLNWVIYTDDTGTTPQNISGSSFVWELRKFRDSPDFVLQKTPTIDNPTGGTLHVNIGRSDTAAFEPGTYYHELARTNAGQYTIETFGDAVLQRGIRP